MLFNIPKVKVQWYSWCLILVLLFVFLATYVVGMPVLNCPLRYHPLNQRGMKIIM